MNRTLYLMLAATLIIGAVGIIRISTLFNQNLIDLEARNGFIAAGLGERTVSTTEDRIKKIVQSKTGDGDVLSNLPCFKCHQMQSWQSTEGSEGFSHTFHIGMELHCLDCHTFVAHGEGMRVVQESCENCHG